MTKLHSAYKHSALKSVRGIATRLSAFAVFAVVALVSGSAFATGAAANAETINGIGQNVITSSSQLPGLLSAFSYLLGLIAGVMGVLKLREHVENPTQTPLKASAIRFAIGGAMMALPIVYEATMTTISGGNAVGAYLSGALQSIGGGSTMFPAGGGPNTNELNNVAENIVTSANALPSIIAAVAYLVGLLLGVTGLLKIKDHVENPQQTSIRVGVIRLIIAGALFALPAIYTALFTTISGGTSTLSINNSTSIDFFSGLLGTFSNFTGNFNNILINIVDATSDVPAAISALGYILGALFGVLGLLKLKDHVESPDQNPLKEAVIRLLTAGALFSLPTIYNTMYVTIAGGDPNAMAQAMSGLGASNMIRSTYTSDLVTCSPLQSFATTAINMINGITGTLGLGSVIPGGGGTTAGEAICGIVFAAGVFPAFLSALAYVIGLIFGIWGIMKLKNHVQNPAQTSLWEGVSRLLAGGAFFALPFVIEVARSTITPTTTSVVGLVTGTISGYNNAGAQDCDGGGGLDVMLSCAMGDMMGPTHVLLNFFSFCAGMILIMIGTSRLIKSAQDGARGPGGIGTLMTFITGGALISYNEMVRIFTTTFFATSTTRTFAQLSYADGICSGGTSCTELDSIHATITAILQFVIIVGLISFVRGIFIIRGVAEGNSQSSIMAGLTHIIAGTLAVNLGPLLSVIQSTLGITNLGITFG